MKLKSNTKREELPDKFWKFDKLEEVGMNY